MISATMSSKSFRLLPMMAATRSTWFASVSARSALASRSKLRSRSVFNSDRMASRSARALAAISGVAGDGASGLVSGLGLAGLNHDRAIFQVGCSYVRPLAFAMARSDSHFAHISALRICNRSYSMIWVRLRLRPYRFDSSMSLLSR